MGYNIHLINKIYLVVTWAIVLLYEMAYFINGDLGSFNNNYWKPLLVGVMVTVVYAVPFSKDYFKAMTILSIPILITGVMFMNDGYSLEKHYTLFSAMGLAAIYFDRRVLVWSTVLVDIVAISLIAAYGPISFVGAVDDSWVVVFTVLLFYNATAFMVWILTVNGQKMVDDAERKAEKIMTLYDQVALSEDLLKKQNEELVNKQMVIDYRENFCSLTGLPNRIHIERHIEKVAGDSGERCAFPVVTLRVENVPEIINTVGRESFDYILRYVSKSLIDFCGVDAQVGHIADGEYIIVVSDCVGTESFGRMLKDVEEFFADSFSVSGTDISLSVSVGVAHYPSDGKAPTDVISASGIAARNAEGSQLFKLGYFNEDMHKKMLRRCAVENLLRLALKEELFYLVYQPQYYPGGRLRGVEALLRMPREVMEDITIPEIISVAEDTGMIKPIGEFVLRQACRHVASWNQMCSSEFVVSINVSPLQLRCDDFVDQLENIIVDTGILPSWMEIEVTENILVDSGQSNIMGMLQRIRAAGVGIAIDDFGMGYSSMSYLRKLPVTTLKIDKVFIDEIDVLPINELFVEEIIGMAHKVGLVVIAEGVETVSQYTHLVEKGCDVMQGYMLGRPSTAEEISQLISNSSCFI